LKESFLKVPSLIFPTFDGLNALKMPSDLLIRLKTNVEPKLCERFFLRTGSLKLRESFFKELRFSPIFATFHGLNI
jgi:hypothetical protein